MANIVPFNESKLPAHIRAMSNNKNSDLLSGMGGVSFPVISIEGKVFSIKRKGSDPEIVNEPGTKVPARALQVVIIKAGPSGNKSAQVFYAGKYVKGSDAKPTCYSNDGVSPASDATEPQAAKCAVCAQNQWGARITEDGKKAKACQSSKRLAVAAPDLLNDPMLLRVPTTSLRALGEYADYLDKRGVSYQAVVTEISFDWTVPHQLLTFKPIGFIDEASVAQVAEMMESDTVGYIVGTSSAPRREGEFAPAPEPAPKPAAKKAAPVVEDDEDDLPAPKTTVKVETPAAKPAPQKAEVKVSEEMEDGLDDALDGLDFDD